MEKLFITQYKAIKYLTQKKKKINGRNNKGQISIFGRGGGNKKKYRLIDFNKFIWNIPGIILRIESDPNRTSLISLISYTNGIINYSLNIKGTYTGDYIINQSQEKNLLGFTSYIKDINLNTKISQIEYNFLSKMQYCRAAGSYAIIIKKGKKNSLLKLNVKKHKIFQIWSIAVIGQISNLKHKLKKYKNAGHRSAMGFKPKVRGVAMNPIDHPHGGGEGKSSGGRPSVTPWGKITKGKKTQKKWKKDVYHKNIKKI